MTDVYNYISLNKSLNNIYMDNIVSLPSMSGYNRLRHRRSIDYGCLTGSGIPSMMRQDSMNNPMLAAVANQSKPSILIRRQSSERCLQKRHSIDSNKSNISDPGGSPTLTGKQSSHNQSGMNLQTSTNQRSPRESSNSPKSMFSSFASGGNVKNSSYNSILLSREGSMNYQNKRQTSELDLENNRKWYSSSSVILTRVKSMKEKFRRVVVQSVQPDDWPPPSVLFSERYRYPSSTVSSSIPINQINNSSQTPISNIKAKRASLQLMKSKSIDPHTYQSITPNSSSFNRKPLLSNLPRNNSINARQLANKRGKLQRSMTSYDSENGIVCTDMDLKAIINNFKREDESSNTSNSQKNLNEISNIELISKSVDDNYDAKNINVVSINSNNEKIVDIKKPNCKYVSKTPTATGTSLGPGFGKRKLMKKQVSFDDEQGVMVINRKVSAIAEEIESHVGLGFENSSHNNNIGINNNSNDYSVVKKNHNNDIIDTGKSKARNIIDKIKSNEIIMKPKRRFSVTSMTEQIKEDEETVTNNISTQNCSKSNSNSRSSGSIPLLLPKEVEFDEHGQTWEVYGADPDPEILGQAIQSHLERLMICRQQPTTNQSHSPVLLPNGGTPGVLSGCTNQISLEEVASGTNTTTTTVTSDTESALISPITHTAAASGPDNSQLRLLVRRLCGSWSCITPASPHQNSTHPINNAQHNPIHQQTPISGTSGARRNRSCSFSVSSPRSTYKYITNDCV